MQKFGERQKVIDKKSVLDFFAIISKKVIKNHDELEKYKRQFSAKHKVPIILNRDIILVIGEKKISPNLKKLLQKRAVRTISGVSPIGILTKPFDCPGKCVYCPTEDRMPKSYMKNQPAAARALRNNFHPYQQVKNRIFALHDSGHPVSKLEIIVMGGTWSFLPHKYQNWYIREIFRASNNISSLLKNKAKIPTKNQKNSLKNLQKINETADTRVIGLTLETRPDFITEKELIRMRNYGCTRIEIGVQTLDDDIQKLTKRGHYRSHIIKAMRLMKDFGFKVCFHLMPGLPGSNPQKDIEAIRETFENPDFCPDFIKIYPCVVLETAELRSWWESGKYKPLSDEDLIPLLLKAKTFVPPWARIMRLLRDIPVSNILDGAKFSNLRQILQSQPQKLREIVGEEFFNKNLKNKEWVCKCIRCREVGFSNDKKNLGEPVLIRRDYEASGGIETFLSFETKNKKNIFALLRLRKPSGQKFAKFGSVLHNSALIREVHSYGSEISIGEDSGLGQHRGLGKKLIAEAERIAKEDWKLKRMTIIAGVGTREYYRKFGYEEKCTYMTKKL